MAGGSKVLTGRSVSLTDVVTGFSLHWAKLWNVVWPKFYIFLDFFLHL